ncbi:uncharacterized protein LOC107641956 isoform X1 [Arachis ipaensis]|uniref:uncharacterized protein LOC107641956 isoform X1 n=1 Tax=Arachis ipaensis TaxID=130454 RepID=UPI000A2B31EA|nr:uncharacterized protein LOC107641956 isoform X1 [Arachis ipaensis]
MAASFLPLPALLALTYMLISRTWILMFLHNFLSMTNVLSSTDVITHFITTITLRPEELPLELKHSFKIVVADPPYLPNEEKAEWIIYVTDVGQQQHFDMVFKILAKCEVP